MFLVAPPDNRQNDRVYAPRDTRKHSIAAERLLQCRCQKVADGLSGRVKARLFFTVFRWARRKGRWSLLPGRATETADAASRAQYCWWHVRVPAGQRPSSPRSLDCPATAAGDSRVHCTRPVEAKQPILGTVEVPWR